MKEENTTSADIVQRTRNKEIHAGKEKKGYWHPATTSTETETPTGDAPWKKAD